MIVTLKDKTDLVVPPTLQRRLGIKAGDRVEFKVSGGIINIIPKLPSADDDYTSRQRKAIDARLAAAKKGLSRSVHYCRCRYQISEQRNYKTQN